MRPGFHFVLLLSAILAVSLPHAVPAGEPVHWLDVNIERGGADGSVSLRVPAGLAGMALAALSNGPYDHGVLHLGSPPPGSPPWNTILSLLNALEPGQSLSLEASGILLRARRSGGIVRIHASRKGDETAELSLALPSSVLTRLSVDANGDLDLAPVLESLPSFPPGDVLTGRDGRATVRVRIE